MVLSYGMSPLGLTVVDTTRVDASMDSSNEGWKTATSLRLWVSPVKISEVSKVIRVQVEHFQ